MARRRPRKKICSDSQREKPNSLMHSNFSPTLLRKLLSAITTPGGMQVPVLKSLYCSLVHLSTGPQNRVDVNDLQDVCDFIFTELSVMFDSIISSVFDISASNDHGQSIIHVNCKVEVLFLLLRCSMVILVLPIPNQNLVLKKGGILFKILLKLCSLNMLSKKDRKGIPFPKSLFHPCLHYSDDFTTTSSEELAVSIPFCEFQTSFAIALLEVFLDELLVHGRLKAIFKRIGRITSPSEPLFMPQPTEKGFSSNKRQCDVGILAELVSTCFLLSFSHENAYEAFLDRLLLARRKDFEFFKAQEMSLTGAISLLLHPITSSAPKIVQAHVVSSVYEAMSNVLNIQKLKLNCKLLNYCISVFEKSMDMYMKHMSCIWTKGHPLSNCASFVKPHTYGIYSPLPFASYVMPSTLEKINSLIKKLEGSSDSFACNHFFEKKSDLATSCVAYLKKCQCLLDQSCRPDVFSIVDCLIVRASESFDETRMPAIKDISLHDICLLVAVLNLMSISLLHAISCLRNEESCGSFKTLKDYSLCKEYMSIVCASSCFSKCQLQFPVQEFLFDITETNFIKHKDFMMMLVHFSGLLAFSFLNRFDYLAKACLLTITAVLNLFVLEDGYLDELKSLVVCGPNSVSSALPLALVNQRSSIKVATKFQNIRNLHSRRSKTMAKCFVREEEEEEGFTENSLNVYHFFADSEDNRVSTEEETALNGESYLKCMQCSTDGTSDYDELADFVACKPGKDYAVWLNDRKKYRAWKSERMAMLMRNRKKQISKHF